MENNSNNTGDDVHSAIVVARSLWELTWFIQRMKLKCQPSHQASPLGLWVCL